jgi:hypothetical protein
VLILMAGLLATAIPLASRNEVAPLLARALAAGPASPQMIALVGYWTVVAIWTVLALARSAVSLSRAPSGSVVLTVRTALRRARRIDLGATRCVMLVAVSLFGVTEQRAFLVNEAGRVLARPRHHRGLWQRDDAWVLLNAAGITVEWDHRLTRPRDIERAYPGALPWIERNGLVYVLAFVGGTAAVVAGVGWLFFGA